MIRAELIGGPLDGEVRDVQDNLPVIVMATPVMTPAQMIALDIVPQAKFSVTEHAYLRDDTRLSKAGNRRYVYQGTRAK
jgi:hypothetical protein